MCRRVNALDVRERGAEMFEFLFVIGMGERGARSAERGEERKGRKRLGFLGWAKETGMKEKNKKVQVKVKVKGEDVGVRREGVVLIVLLRNR